MSACRYCEATIRFVQLDTGKAIPVNPIPDRLGNVAARPQGIALVGYVISQAKPLQAGHQTYRPHKADCRPDKPSAPRAASLFDSSALTGQQSRRTS